MLNRFGETTNGQPVPLGKPWDRQPNSGKLRRKLVSVPSLRRISGQLSPKRLSTRVGAMPECFFNAETQRTQREAQRTHKTVGGTVASRAEPGLLLVYPWFLCAYLCVLCVSALNGRLAAPLLPGC